MAFPEDGFDPVKIESVFLQAEDRSQLGQLLVRVTSETARGSVTGLDQPHLLVVTNRASGCSHTLRQFSDVHRSSQTTSWEIVNPTIRNIP